MLTTPLVAQGSIAPCDGEIFCDKCNTVLMPVLKDDMLFKSKWCDCNWACCEHSKTNQNVQGYKCHAQHMQFRAPMTGEWVIVKSAPRAEYDEKDGIGCWYAYGSWRYRPMDDAFNKPWKDALNKLRSKGYVTRTIFVP